MSFTSSVPTFATEEFNSRADYARAAIHKGTWSKRDAYKKLAPWLSMALLCGADVDDLNLFHDDRNTLHNAIADLHIKSTDGRELNTVGQARWHVADGICPRKAWVPELIKARDAAMAAIKPGDEATQMKAAGFIAMALLIGHDPDGRYSVPPYTAPEPMQEAA